MGIPSARKPNSVTRKIKSSILFSPYTSISPFISFGNKVSRRFDSFLFSILLKSNIIFQTMFDYEMYSCSNFCMNFKDKITNFSYINLFNNLSFIIIEFLFIVFLFANIGFILHLSITWLYLVITLPIIYFSLIKLNKSFKDVNLQFFVFLSLIIVSFLIVNGRGDYSYDGSSYHFQAMFCLKNGWNPLLQESISFGEKYHLYANHTWVQIWPKFCETVSACFYQLTDIIESGFVVNCLIACAVFFRSITVLSLFSERKYLNLLFSSLIILNPVVIAQFFTMYVDLIMYFMFILFLLNIMEIIKQDKFSNFNFWSLVLIGSIMPNLKITGLFYLAIISVIFLFTYKKYAKTRRFST